MNRDWTVVPIGPATIAVPRTWEVIADGREGVVQVALPLDEGSRQSPPGMVRPNIAVRYLEARADEGGIAKVAADELRAVLTLLPGTSVLAVTEFYTQTGLPGRAHVLTGIEKRVPFFTHRWYVGLPDVVVEVVLTGPNTSSADLVQIGEAAAQSVRVRNADPEASASVPENAMPRIPESRLDFPLMAYLEGQGPDQSTPHRVERVSELLADLVPGDLPAPKLVLSPAAAEHFQTVASVGMVSRFSGEQSAVVQELQAAELLNSDGALTDLGAHIGSGLGEEPSLTLNGKVFGHETQGSMWFDGLEATLILGPSAADLRDGAAQRCYIYREMGLSANTIVDAWAGVRADWLVELRLETKPTDVASALNAARVPSALTKNESVEGQARAAEGQWSCAAAGSDHRLDWIQTHDRGPFYLVSGHQGQLELVSTTGLSIHENLAALVKQAADDKVSGPNPPQR